MAKQLNTKVTLSVTHDRMAVTAKFVNGERILYSLTRNKEGVSVSAPVGSSINKDDINSIYKYCQFLPGEGLATGANMVRFKRLEAFFQGTTSIMDAASKARAA